MENQNQRLPVTYTKMEKDVGVMIDGKLDFENHIISKVNEANSMFAVIRRTYKFLDIDTFKPFYTSLVRSHLECASSMWAPCKMKHVEIIEKVQKQCFECQLPNKMS